LADKAIPACDLAAANKHNVLRLHLKLARYEIKAEGELAFSLKYW